jgi:hypothetical protein
MAIKLKFTFNRDDMFSQERYFKETPEALLKWLRSHLGEPSPKREGNLPHIPEPVPINGKDGFFLAFGFHDWGERDRIIKAYGYILWIGKDENGDEVMRTPYIDWRPILEIEVCDGGRVIARCVQKVMLTGDWGGNQELMTRLIGYLRDVFTEMERMFATKKVKKGVTPKTEIRFKTIKRIKERNPRLTQEQVALRASEELGEHITVETVRNVYRAMGEKWDRGDWASSELDG